MDILHNLIGFRGLEGHEAPSSGLFLNDLPGMSAELVEAISSSDQAGAVGVLLSAQARASSLFKDQVITALEERLTYGRTILEADGVRLLRPAATVAAADFGLWLYVPHANKKDIQLNHLELWAVAAVAEARFVAYDTDSWEPVELVPPVPAFALEAGFNRVPLAAELRLRYASEGLFLTVEADGLEMRRVHNPDPLEEAELIEYFGGRRNGDQVYGEPSAPFGLGITVSCSLEKHLARHIKKFAVAYQYLLGAELLREKIHSLRANFFSTSNIQLTRENLSNFNQRAATALESAAKGVPLDNLCGDESKHQAISYEYTSL